MKYKIRQQLIPILSQASIMLVGNILIEKFPNYTFVIIIGITILSRLEGYVSGILSIPKVP